MAEKSKRNLVKTLLFFLVIIIINFLIVAVDYTYSKIPDKYTQNQTKPHIIKEKKIIVHANDIPIEVRTNKAKVKDLILEMEIEIGDEDYLFPSPESNLKNNSNVIINLKNDYKISADGQEIDHKSYKRIVKEVLKEAEIEINQKDEVDPELNEVLANDSKINVVRVETEEITVEKTIEFETITKEDSDLDWDESKVKQEGEPGLQEITYLVTYKNNKESEREEIKREIVKEPSDKIVVKGTKVRTGKAKKGLASWYAYTGKMACASLEHPKGTWLKVTNVDNGKSVNVVVNDSGPYVDGRIVDLDKEAFKKIGNLSAGVIEVKVEKIK